jgi:hypothetical protein
VAIYRYVTEGSFDAYMWQALETCSRAQHSASSRTCHTVGCTDMVVGSRSGIARPARGGDYSRTSRTGHTGDQPAIPILIVYMGSANFAHDCLGLSQVSLGINLRNIRPTVAEDYLGCLQSVTPAYLCCPRVA